MTQVDSTLSLGQLAQRILQYVYMVSSRMPGIDPNTVEYRISPAVKSIIHNPSSTKSTGQSKQQRRISKIDPQEDHYVHSELAQTAASSS